MRKLFEIDSHKALPNALEVVRPSCRSIIIKDGLIAMVYSKKYNYYKFPGGGIENNEDHLSCVVRETIEEAGLKIIPSSLKEFGMVRRIDSYDDKKFIQDNYYYLCKCSDGFVSQNLDDYENEEGFTLVWIKPDVAINANRTPDHGPKKPSMIEREARVLEILIEEGYFN